MISFASATGNLFNRLGKVGLTISEIDTYQAAQLTNLTDTTNGVVAQYDSESDLQAIVGSSYVSILNTPGGSASTMTGLASATVNRMVFRDNPQYGQTLTQGNLITSINEVIRQMKIAGATVRACTITCTPTTFLGTGNGIIVASNKRPSDGVVVENSFSENLILKCSADSYTGGATAGNEVFALTGAGINTNPFAFDWPLGSGANTSLQAIDGNTSNGAGNILTNSGFTNWTNNVPNFFSLTVGVAGTNISQDTGIVYDDTGSSLKITGDSGGTLTALTQVFNSGSGTGGTLSPLTQYGFNLFIRRDGVAASTGVLTIELIDDGGNDLEDAAGFTNAFTIDLTTLTTAFASYTVAFRTPDQMPTVYLLRLRLSTALEDGRSVYLDKMSLGTMTQAYTSGPFVSVHSGSVPFVYNDYGTVVVVNSRGAGGSLNTFQTLWDRMFGMRSNDILLPSSATPTISDSLIG